MTCAIVLQPRSSTMNPAERMRTDHLVFYEHELNSLYRALDATTYETVFIIERQRKLGFYWGARRPESSDYIEIGKDAYYLFLRLEERYSQEVSKRT